MRLLIAEFAANLRRDAGGEGLRWDLLSLHHKRAGSDERARAHYRTRQQRGLHSNQRASAHVRAVQHRHVTNRNVILQDTRNVGFLVDDGIVLDVDAGA